METATNIKEFKGYAQIKHLGRRSEIFKKIEEFKKTAKSTYISIKRKSATKAIKEFKDLYEVKEYFGMYHNDSFRKDDSFEIWYTQR